MTDKDKEHIIKSAKILEKSLKKKIIEELNSFSCSLDNKHSQIQGEKWNTTKEKWENLDNQIDLI